MKLLASLSLDLDNQWSYMKTHGDPGWESYPSYLDVVVPRVLEILAARGLSITFFVVGQDAAQSRNHDALMVLAESDHEIANHSFAHEPWLHLYSREDLAEDISKAEEAIERVTSRRTVGFRGPGFSLTSTTLEILAQRGYHYDASTFPTYIGPVARAYYLRTTTLDREETGARDLLFGSFSDGFRPIKPYRWQLTESDLIEVPVTTMPIFKIPIHVSYLLYLAMFSPALSRAYFRFALALCRVTGVQPSILLHPLDFLGKDDTTALEFFPAMRHDSDFKLRQVDRYLSQLTSFFDVVSVGKFASSLEKHPNLPVRSPQSTGA